jgi:iron complex transport system substrate-binding protein
MFKIKKSIGAVLIIVVFVAFCGFASTKLGNTKTNATIYPLKVVDSFKRTVTIDKEPQRIISVAPSISQIIFALGKGDKLVGRTDYCDYPAAVKNVSSIGELVNPNIEKIVELKPDIVIASDLMNKDAIAKLEALNIKVVIFYGEESFNGVYDTIAKIGNVLNANEKANNTITSMKYRVALVVNKAKAAKTKPSVYYVVSYGKMGDYAATKGTFIGNMIEMAGGVNAANDATGWKYSVEKLVEKNPDILICPKFYGYKDGIKTTPGYMDLKAVKSGKLLEIDNNLLDQQGPRLGEGLQMLAKLIHPELFK